MDLHDDNQIILRVLNGDADAFGAIVEKYQRAVYNLMYRATHSEEVSADLTQDAFIKAYDKIDLFERGKRFFPWLYTLSMNVARDYLRRKKKATVAFDDMFDNVPLLEKGMVSADGVIDFPEIIHLHRALSRLPLDDRETVMLRYQEGLSMKDIAQTLELSVSGAKMRLHRALKKLRDLLEKDD